MGAIKREERIGGQRLILGDCLEVMRELGRFDALVTDPPYGIGAGSGFSNGGKRYGKTREYKNGSWDLTRPSKSVFERMVEISNFHIIWGGNYFTDMIRVSGKWLFWDKCQTMPTYSDGELAWTSLDGVAVKQFTYNGSGMQAKEKDRVHPTQKPVALMEWCLGFLPNATTILDPFMGSGTTLVACQRMGRMGTGIELDPEYFDIACKRVEEAARQPDMFVSAPVHTAKQEELF